MLGLRDGGRTVVEVGAMSEGTTDQLFPRPEDSTFVGLVRQIQQGATQIVKAADELTQQISNHHNETGEFDEVRYAALEQLASALNGSVHFFGRDEFEQQISRRGDTSRFGVSMTHGLSNCAKLANRAEHFLSRFKIFAEATRKNAGSPALPMKKGRRADQDRDEFVHDLETIYERLFPGNTSRCRL